jgi:hypothetical protein
MITRTDPVIRNYESGATHDDKRSQLLFGKESEKLVQFKKLSNE